MNTVELRHLTINDQDQFYDVLNESWEKNFDFAHYWESVAHKNYDTFIKVVPEFSIGKHIPKDHVPCTFLFAFNNEGKLVGRTSIRHSLNDYLLQVGGHIGYGVAPKYRKKGYATSILKETLSYVRTNLPSLEKVLLTCDEDNIASRKTIEKNDGILENIITTPNGAGKARYWITILRQ